MANIKNPFGMSAENRDKARSFGLLAFSEEVVKEVESGYNLAIGLIAADYSEERSAKQTVSRFATTDTEKVRREVNASARALLAEKGLDAAFAAFTGWLSLAESLGRNTKAVEKARAVAAAAKRGRKVA